MQEQMMGQVSWRTQVGGTDEYPVWGPKVAALHGDEKPEGFTLECGYFKSFEELETFANWLSKRVSELKITEG